MSIDPPDAPPPGWFADECPDCGDLIEDGVCCNCGWGPDDEPAEPEGGWWTHAMEQKYPIKESR